MIQPFSYQQVSNGTFVDLELDAFNQGPIGDALIGNQTHWSWLIISDVRAQCFLFTLSVNIKGLQKWLLIGMNFK